MEQQFTHRRNRGVIAIGLSATQRKGLDAAVRTGDPWHVLVAARDLAEPFDRSNDVFGLWKDLDRSVLRDPPPSSLLAGCYVYQDASARIALTESSDPRDHGLIVLEDVVDES
jgi:hypothetical protein